MKTRYFIYPFVITLMLLLPITRYYTSTPWVNACVIDYVENLEKNDNKWIMYNINWVNHIEWKNSSNNKALSEYKIWEAYWCIMASWNLFNDLNNTIYCSIAYLIQKSPMHEKLKQPLSILKD